MNKQLNLCPGKSVGAIIKNNEDKFLCLYRLKYPKGLAFLAGHINSGESPKMAVKREVKEEAGINILRLSCLFIEVFLNPCGRGDYDGHEWYVYKVLEWEGEVENMEESKHSFVKFLSWEEIQEYIKKGEYDPAWFNFVLPALALTCNL